MTTARLTVCVLVLGHITMCDKWVHKTMCDKWVHKTMCDKWVHKTMGDKWVHKTMGDNGFTKQWYHGNGFVKNSVVTKFS